EVLKPHIKSALVGLAKYVGPLMASVFFGPMLLRGIFATAASSFLRHGSKAFAQLSTKLAGRSGLKAASRFAGPAAIVAAAASIGEGVKKYSSKITAVVDEEGKTIAAGATGLVEGLTLGLLPNDFYVTIANTLAKAQEMLFQALGSVFGTSFAGSL